MPNSVSKRNLEQILRLVFWTLLIALCLTQPWMGIYLAIDTSCDYASPLMNVLSAYLVPLFTYLLSVLKDWVIFISMTELDLGFGAQPFETMDCEGYNELTSGWKDWLNKSLLSFSAPSTLSAIHKETGLPGSYLYGSFYLQDLATAFSRKRKYDLALRFKKWVKKRTARNPRLFG